MVMPAKPAVNPSSVMSRPLFWGVAWFIIWAGARAVLESQGIPAWTRVVAALSPVPFAAAALFTLVRTARELDELERRIQLEALAFAFILSLLLLMTLGLMELAVPLNRDDWSYRHVWAMLPTLYFLGLVLARRRYA
jgi:hypothetical protein